VAGTGTPGSTGDCGLATNATLNWPQGVSVDASGNIYITDTWYTPRIRKVDAVTGIITTVAGTGTPGYDGDNQPATAARLDYPTSVFVNDYGDIYITDNGNERIRKVAGDTGIIATMAGTGTAGHNGDDQQATAAMLRDPYGTIAVRHDRSKPPQWGWAIVEELY